MYLTLRNVFIRVINLLSNRLVINVLLGFVLFEYVECKHCTYPFDSGHIKHFFCSAYEYCCGPLCCRSRSIGFFQLWYFWLMIILMLMLCSGGGWWYKFRYHNHYRQGIGGPNFGMSNNTTGFRPFTYNAGVQPQGQPCPAPYPAGMGASYPPNAGPYPPHMAGAAIYPPATNMGGPYPMMGTPYPAQPMGAVPPPPYTGPPPSYAVATTGTAS